MCRYERFLFAVWPIYLQAMIFRNSERSQRFICFFCGWTWSYQQYERIEYTFVSFVGRNYELFNNKRRRESEPHAHVKQLRQDDPDYFKNYIWLDENNFNRLLSLVEVKLRTKYAVMREGSPAEKRFIVTLRCLACN